MFWLKLAKCFGPYYFYASATSEGHLAIECQFLPDVSSNSVHGEFLPEQDGSPLHFGTSVRNS